MHLAICDDEQKQLDIISELLMEYRNELNLSFELTTFQTGFALLSAMEDGADFDAVFLDIFMDDMNGMEVAHKIRQHNNIVKIIFLTSSSDFAVESYRVDATDYILKPVIKDNLYSTMTKLSQHIVAADANTDSIIVHDRSGGIIRVSLNSIMYVEAMGHTCDLLLNNGTAIHANTSFSILMEQLDNSKLFVQIHRSYLVNLQYIHRLTNTEIFLLGDYRLPLSRSRRQLVLEQFMDYSFNGGTL